MSGFFDREDRIDREIKEIRANRANQIKCEMCYNENINQDNNKNLKQFRKVIVDDEKILVPKVKLIAPKVKIPNKRKNKN